MGLAVASAGKFGFHGEMFKRAFLPLVLFCLGLGFLWWTQQSPFWAALRQIAGVMRLVHEEYVNPESVDYERLAEEAVRGMVESLDAHSRYLPAEDFAHFEELTKQKYVGIGVEIERLGERVTVVTAFPDGPAERSGVLPGDQILAVNGADMSAATVVQVSEALRGLEGEVAELTVRRPETDESLDFSLVRGAVEIASVQDVSLLDDGVGYLAIRQFGERTAEEFRAALVTLENQGMRGLIMDLRNNPGGLLTTSKDVAAEFFEAGELVVYTQGRTLVSREEFRSATPARAATYPIAVLINDQSASGAEIVAGALQDTGRAYVIGEASYGKGSVQSVYAFKWGGGLRQTTALYYLPSGRSINEVGVAPDEEIALSTEEERGRLLYKRHRKFLSDEAFERLFEIPPDGADRQLDAARRYLQEAIVPLRA